MPLDNAGTGSARASAQQSGRSGTQSASTKTAGAKAKPGPAGLNPTFDPLEAFLAWFLKQGSPIGWVTLHGAVRYIDGVTIAVSGTRIRLASVRPAEGACGSRPCSAAAEAFLRSAISGQPVVCTKGQRLGHGYFLGSCTLNGRGNLAEMLIREGLAAVEAGAPERFVQAESQAKADGKGRWLAQVNKDGQWTSGVAMPSARSEIAAAQAGGKIYVIGDYAGQRALEIYDPASDRWSRGADFPVAIHHAAAVGWNNKVYVLGGYMGDDLPSDGVYEYDIPLDSWRALPALPTPRGSPSATILNGKIHVVSGVGSDGRNTPAHEVYDIETARWTARAPIRTPRDHFSLVRVGEMLFALGGRVDGDYGRNLAANERYDPKSDSWQQRNPMPTARSGIAAAALNGRIFVFGGESQQRTFGEVESYDPSSDFWSTHAPMPTPRHGLAAIALGERIYTVAGGPQPGASASATIEIYWP
jgi:endonuclease YncB( thermonuclease family)